MAERIEYDVKPTPIGPDAHQELERLLEGLHEQGVLRFANNVVRSQSPLAHVLIEGIGKEGTLNVIQNLSILGMALSRIPPDEFYKMVFSIKAAMTEFNKQAGDGDDSGAAPGVRGTYRMLHDGKLWASLSSLLEALKVFSERMGKEADKPVTEFTGKPTDN